jgi:hypothetical protein
MPFTRVMYNKRRKREARYLSVVEYFRFFDHPINDLIVRVMAIATKKLLAMM